MIRDSQFTMSRSKTPTLRAIQFVGGVLFLSRDDLSFPSLLVRQPLKHTSRDERVERWPTVARHRGGQDARTRSSWNFRCIVVAGTTSNLAAVPEKRDTPRGWRRGEMVPNGERENGGADIQYACRRCRWYAGVRRPRRRRNWRKLSYFRPAENKRCRRSYEKRCPITGPRRHPGDLSIYFLGFISSDLNSVQLLRAAYCTYLFYIISIDGVETVDDDDDDDDDDVNKLHRSCTVRWYQKFDARVPFHSER